MKDSDKVKMVLNIGDQRLTLNVRYDRQDFVREVEQTVSMLYAGSRKNFPQKTDREILAMVAYQFASHYCDMKKTLEKAEQQVSRCLSLTEPQPENQSEDDPFED